VKHLAHAKKKAKAKPRKKTMILFRVVPVKAILPLLKKEPVKR
jgi:hypothetical protein